MLRALSVTELSNYVTGIFDAEELLHYVQVYGEISNLSYVRGNLYFNLKDESSLLPCIMFGASSCPVKEGDQVMLTGGLKYYAKGGKLNFYANSIVPYGSGILFQKFLQLKSKLEQEGVFDNQYKKQLPSNINKIGVVTSSTGAVLHDIETVSHRRNPTLDIVVYPARVQGEGAEQTIIDGLHYLDKLKDIDVIIIARGGGSIEDLQPFNTESLAREIVKANKPVISAVGHETDFTICDFASSLRAATPSEAAEIVSVNMYDKLSRMSEMVSQIYFKTQTLFDEKILKFDSSINKIENKYDKFLSKKEMGFNKLLSKLERINPLDKIENNFNLCQERLLSLNPTTTLKRGWARVSKDGHIVKDGRKLNLGDNLYIEFLQGSVNAVVNNKE